MGPSRVGVVQGADRGSPFWGPCITSPASPSDVSCSHSRRSWSPVSSTPPLKRRECVILMSILAPSSKVCVAYMAQHSPEVRGVNGPGTVLTSEGREPLGRGPPLFTCPGRGLNAQPSIFWLDNSGSHSVGLSGGSGGNESPHPQLTAVTLRLDLTSAFPPLLSHCLSLIPVS